MTTVLSALNPFKRQVNKTFVTTPVRPTATQASAGADVAPYAAGGFSSFIASGSSAGLTRKASTRKRSLIGGSA